MTDLDLAQFCHFARDRKLMERAAILLSGWALAYPDANVDICVKEAHLWLLNNEPHYKDMRRFLTNWMRRAQQDALDRRETERRLGERRAPKKYVEVIPADEDLMTADDWKKIRESLPR